MGRSRPLLERHYPETRFGGFSNVDGTLAFYARVNALLSPESVVLDVGCGRGAHADDPVAFRRGLRVLRGKARRVIGIDPDPGAADNPFIDEFRLAPDARWPLDDAAVDVAVADYVLEHVADPARFFAEAHRVLRPDGVLCIRTTNVASYVGLVARLVPNRWHGRTVSRVQDGRDERDVFPTLYRCNTAGRLRRLLARSGFEATVFGFEGEPQYLAFSSLAYRFGVWHQRLAPGRLRLSLFAFAARV